MPRPIVRILLPALLALAAAAAPGTAAAAPRLAVPAAATPMTVAHGLAVARWGTDPCGGKVAVSWQHMGLRVNALSRWMMTSATDPGTYFDCTISYNLDVRWDWPKLCTVVEHELGHLAGHAHVDDPEDVMSPYYYRPTPECATAGPVVVAASTPVKHKARKTKPRRPRGRRGGKLSAKQRSRR
jgi:matrixin